MMTVIKCVPYICSFIIHAMLFALLYNSFTGGIGREQSGNDIKISRKEAGMFKQISQPNSACSDEQKNKIENEYNKKYRDAYSKINDIMKENGSNTNFRIDDFVNDINKSQKTIDSQFSEYTRKMIDEDITNGILKNTSEYIKKMINEDIKRDLMALKDKSKNNKNSDRSKSFRELAEINREAVNATLKKFDESLLNKYKEKLEADIKQKYSGISLLPENRKELKKIIDESAEYLKSKMLKEVAKLDIFKEELKNNNENNIPDLNTKIGNDIAIENNTINKLEKMMDRLVEKSDELDSNPDGKNLDDYKKELSDIRNEIKGQLGELLDKADSLSLKETAQSMMSEIDKNEFKTANKDQLKDAYKKSLDETVENISILNFIASHYSDQPAAWEGVSNNDRNPKHENNLKDKTVLDNNLKNKIDKSAEISVDIISNSIEKEMKKNVSTYNAQFSLDQVENSRTYAFGIHPGDYYKDEDSVRKDDSKPVNQTIENGTPGASGSPIYADLNRKVEKYGDGGGFKEIGLGPGHNDKREGDERFTRKFTAADTGMGFRVRDLIEFMKKFGSRSRALNLNFEYSAARGEATEATPVSYSYPKYVYISEEQKSQIEELMKNNEDENNKKEMSLYSSFPAYARIPYQPHELKIDGDLSEWGELDNPVQMQYASDNGHDKLTNGVKLYMRWNESGFYFAYKSDNTNRINLPDEIEDDYDRATYDVTQDKCDGDTFEFWIDQADNQEPTAWESTFIRLFTFSPFAAPGLYIDYFRQYEHRQIEDNYHVRITNRQTPTGYIVEAFLSKDVLPKNVALHPKKQFVCNFSINQGSDWGPYSSQWSASRAIDSRVRPNTWGCIELMGYKPEIEVKDYNQEGPGGKGSEFIFPGQAVKIYIKDPERIFDSSSREIIPAYVGIIGNDNKKKINLIETEKGSGLFYASINTKSFENSTMADALLVRPGDILFVEYRKYNESSTDEAFNQKYFLYLPVVNSFYSTMK